MRLFRLIPDLSSLLDVQPVLKGDQGERRCRAPHDHERTRRIRPPLAPDRPHHRPDDAGRLRVCAGQEVSESRRGAGIAAFVLVGLLLSSVSGLAYALITSDEYEAGLQREQEREDAITQDWCDHVTSSIGTDHPVRSFEDLARAARAGELETPDERPATSDQAQLDRWQEDHAAYVTSSYVTALEGYPRDLTIAAAALKMGIGDAHAGKAGSISPSSLRSAARMIDRFVVERC